MRFVKKIIITEPKSSSTNKKLDVLKEIFLKWSLKSTCSAYASIFKAEKFYLKLMWSISLVVSLSFCCLAVIKSILAYLDYEVITKIRLIEERPMIFPVVSICNLNPFITQKANEFILDYFNSNYNQTFENLDQILDKISILNPDFEYLMQQVADPSFPNENKKLFGHSLEQSVINCRFNRSKCNLTEFEWFYSPAYGNCFRFNSGFDKNGQKIPLKYSYSAGIESGLNLELFIGPENKTNPLFTYWEHSGIKVNIFDQTYLTSYEEGIEAPSGFSTNIAISKQVTINEPKPYSSCDNLNKLNKNNLEIINFILNSNFSYRQKDCFEYCYQKVAEERCGCFDLYFPNFGTEMPCYLNESNYECLVGVYLNFLNRDFADYCFSLCPLECESVSFATKISYSDFPSRAYSKLMLKNLSKYFNNQTKIEYQELRENVLQLRIHYDELKYTFISEKPKILVEDLFANIGGTLSLFIGISILSLGELIELAVQIIRVLLSNEINY